MFGLSRFKNEEYTLCLACLGYHTLRTKSTKELTIRANDMNRKASLTNRDHLPMVRLVRVF